MAPGPPTWGAPGERMPGKPQVGRDEALSQAWAQVIHSLGYDARGHHLRDSPARVARFMSAWHTNGLKPPKLTVFPNSERYDQLVTVGGMRFFSMCAHHGLPFYGIAAVGYIPGKSVVGLSKLARVVDHFSRRFQTQEQLTHDVARYLLTQLKPKAVGVVMEAEHFCMSMRGIERPGHCTRTSAMLGAFRSKPAARAELLGLLRVT